MKILKYSLIVIVLLALAGVITYWILDKPLPEGEQGKAAEALADDMLLAVNDSAWKATPIVSWNYQNEHSLVWDKKRHYTKVSWEEYDIYVNLSNKSGVAFVRGKKVRDSVVTAEFVQKAYGFWVNDSFWLNPITKIRDAGTSRSLVNLDTQKQEGLLVSYNSGGLTPGDSYLWIVDHETKRPTAVQMWVSTIPLGGIEFSWEEYVKTETEAIVSTYHKGLIEVFIYDLTTYKSIDDFDSGDIFSVLE